MQNTKLRESHHDSISVTPSYVRTWPYNLFGACVWACSIVVLVIYPSAPAVPVIVLCTILWHSPVAALAIPCAFILGFGSYLLWIWGPAALWWYLVRRAVERNLDHNLGLVPVCERPEEAHACLLAALRFCQQWNLRRKYASPWTSDSRRAFAPMVAELEFLAQYISQMHVDAEGLMLPHQRDELRMRLGAMPPIGELVAQRLFWYAYAWRSGTRAVFRLLEAWSRTGSK